MDYPYLTLALPTQEEQIEEQIPGIIEHIDGKDISDEERESVTTTTCLNCNCPYSAEYPVLLVRTVAGRFWWHRYHCAGCPEKDV